MKDLESLKLFLLIVGIEYLFSIITFICHVNFVSFTGHRAILHQLGYINDRFHICVACFVSANVIYHADASSCCRCYTVVRCGAVRRSGQTCEDTAIY